MRDTRGFEPRAHDSARQRLEIDPLGFLPLTKVRVRDTHIVEQIANLLIETDRVDVVAGTPQAVDVPRDDGPDQRIFRCPTCQVAVFSQYTSPLLRFVRAGTLDDPIGVTPDVHIFTRSRVAWVTLPPATPAFDVYYDTEALWPAASFRRLKAALAITGPPDLRA